MPNEESPSKSSLPQLLLVLAVFVGAFFAVKLIWGLAMTVMKWALMGGIALILTWFVVRKLGSDSSSS